MKRLGAKHFEHSPIQALVSVAAVTPRKTGENRGRTTFISENRGRTTFISLVTENIENKGRGCG
jgi:hypothetical protein